MCRCCYGTGEGTRRSQTRTRPRPAGSEEDDAIRLDLMFLTTKTTAAGCGKIVERVDEASKRVVKGCAGWIRHSGFKPSDPASTCYGEAIKGGKRKGDRERKLVTMKEVSAALRRAADRTGCGEGKFTSHGFRKKLGTATQADESRRLYAQTMGQ